MLDKSELGWHWDILDFDKVICENHENFLQHSNHVAELKSYLPVNRIHIWHGSMKPGTHILAPHIDQAIQVYFPIASNFNQQRLLHTWYQVSRAHDLQCLQHKPLEKHQTRDSISTTGKDSTCASQCACQLSRCLFASNTLMFKSGNASRSSFLCTWLTGA